MRRVARVAIRVVACAIAAAAVLAVVDRWSQIDEGLQLLGPQIRVATTEPEPSGSGSCYDSDSAAGLFLTGAALQAQQATLDVDVGLCAGVRILRNIRARAANRPPIWFGDAIEPRVRPRYADLRLTITAEGTWPSFRWSAQMTLHDFFEADQFPAPTAPGRLTLPLIGHPDAYPLDEFEQGDMSFRVLLPDGVVFAPRGQPYLADALPVRATFLSGPAMADFRFAVHEAANVDPADATVYVFAERDASTKLFVGMVLLVPLLFALLLALALGRRARSEGGPEFRDLLFGVIGATLSLLPLRQVLVPAELQVLTLVDWCLGAAVMIFAAVIVWWVPSALR